MSKKFKLLSILLTPAFLATPLVAASCQDTKKDEVINKKENTNTDETSKQDNKENTSVSSDSSNVTSNNENNNTPNNEVEASQNDIAKEITIKPLNGEIKSLDTVLGELKAEKAKEYEPNAESVSR
ncbi:variable surface lipoprotein, partial [Mycoplasma struthionis]